MLPVLTWYMGPTKNLTCVRFTTGKGLSSSMLSFLNMTTIIWYYPSFTNDECAANDTSVDEFYTLLYLHDYVALLYCNIM